MIAGKFGEQSLPAKPPVYTRKAKGAQEAHEAIRPTDVSRDPESVKKFLSQPQFRLYQLVWQRFVASQMANAILDGTTVDIAAGRDLGENLTNAPYTFRATGSVIRFPGFMAVYQQGRDEGETDELDDGALPKLTEKQRLDLQKLVPEQHFTQPPPRFTEASLVKALEEAGIGRPSTYAPTIATLLARSYVTIDEKKLVPAELGFVVSDLLAEHFPNVFDIGFTSQMEEELDEIASGDRPWVPTLREFYEPFSETMKKAEFDRTGQAQGRASRGGLREVRPPDADQAGQVRQVPGLQRVPGVPERQAAPDHNRHEVPNLPRGRCG